jgi:hypothetical protein
MDNSALMDKSLILLLLCLVAVSAFADDVYRWVGPDGVVHYADHPPAAGAAPAQLPPLQTFDPQQVAGGHPLTPADSSTPAASFKPRIVRPQNKETFRDGQRTLTVSLVDPPTPGVGLVYYLDGKALNSEPISAPDFTLSDVERGEHSIQVAAVDSAGKEFARSDTVVVYMMPPRVGMVPQTSPVQHH